MKQRRSLHRRTAAYSHNPDGSEPSLSHAVNLLKTLDDALSVSLWKGKSHTSASGCGVAGTATGARPVDDGVAGQGCDQARPPGSTVLAQSSISNRIPYDPARIASGSRGKVCLMRAR